MRRSRCENVVLELTTYHEIMATDSAPDIYSLFIDFGSDLPLFPVSRVHTDACLKSLRTDMESNKPTKNVRNSSRARKEVKT